ncbi:phosphatidate cytidylyltransferase [Allosalinactinospora lopnorensis]|uniref:phosphatidate cytidylyltransferase n=1 Tax=Allosalinactinospora lopnorensis TaxID=1352348 RepID=UPI000623DCF9|nr:phosphatidate cytidylyltransferase [Allosalinactinospora lopnorensis]
MAIDRELVWLSAGVLGLLVIATAVGAILRRNVVSDSAIATVDNLNARTRAWWAMCAVFALAVAMGPIGSILLFGLTSFLALREFVTLTPARSGDHRALFWAFFIVIPVQYLLVAGGWYGLFSIFIPVYAFLFIPVRAAMAGDTTDFLGRAAKTQWALMICVYCVSHAPALLMLEIPGYAEQNLKLLFFLVFVVQASDVLQYIWGKTLGRRPIAPRVSPGKTVEGFVGGIVSATLLGAAMWWITPFSPWQAGAMSLTIALMGFAGGLTMSAIKRDRGIKDYGTMIKGHGGIMDRIDSICFAAPVFFHLTHFFFV